MCTACPIVCAGTAETGLERARVVIVYPNESPSIPSIRLNSRSRFGGRRVAGLHERPQALARREAAAGRTPEPEMIVVDDKGRETGMRGKRVTVGLARERHEDELRELDEQVAAIDEQVKLRDAWNWGLWRASGGEPSRGAHSLPFLGSRDRPRPFGAGPRRSLLPPDEPGPRAAHRPEARDRQVTASSSTTTRNSRATSIPL